MTRKVTEYTEQYIANWNLDETGRDQDPVAVRGVMYKSDSGSTSGQWVYWNGSVNLSGDIQIGSVEIKDQGSDSRVTVANSAMWVAEQGTWAATSALQGTGNNQLTAAIAQLTALNYESVRPSAVVSGRKTFATANSAIALGSTTTLREVTLKALWANTSSIYIGGSTLATASGFELAPGDAVSLPISDLATLYGASEVANEGITYLGVA